MNKLHIYKTLPKKGDLVSIIITNNKPDTGSIQASLPDYKNLIGIIPIVNLAKQIKKKNINKVAPLHKILVARIDNINESNIILTRKNILKTSDEYKKWENNKESSKKINSLLIFMKQKNIDYDTIYDKIIFVFEEKWDKKNSIFDFIKDNYKSLELDIEEDVKEYFYKFIEKTNSVNKIIFKTKFRMVATNSLKDMIDTIKPIITKYKTLDIKLDTFPDFTIISHSHNSKKEDHLLCLNELKSLVNTHYLIQIVS